MMKVWKEDYAQLTGLLASANPKADHQSFAWQQMMDECFVASESTFFDNMNAMGAHDYSARLGEVACPALITCSPDDLWIPMADIDKMIEKMPNARKLEIAGIGHTPALETPDLFLENALSFWR